MISIFREGAHCLRRALPAARKIAALKVRARRAKVPVIYVNDNFGRWQSDFRQQVEHCLKPESTGRPVVELLKPNEEDYFVLKPMHSGFHCTPLEILIDRLGARRIILCGFAADICVLYTANDAYMRGYDLVIPCDCVASETDDGTRFVVGHMKHQLKANTAVSARLRLRGGRTRLKAPTASPKQR